MNYNKDDESGLKGKPNRNKEDIEDILARATNRAKKDNYGEKTLEKNIDALDVVKFDI